ISRQTKGRPSTTLLPARDQPEPQYSFTIPSRSFSNLSQRQTSRNSHKEPFSGLKAKQSNGGKYRSSAKHLDYELGCVSVRIGKLPLSEPVHWRIATPIQASTIRQN